MPEESAEKLKACANALCALGDALRRTYDVRMQREPENANQWEKWRAAMDNLEARMELLDDINRRFGAIMENAPPDGSAREELRGIVADVREYHARFGGVAGLLAQLESAQSFLEEPGECDEPNLGD